MFMQPEKMIESIEGAVEAQAMAFAHIDALTRINNEEIDMVARHKGQRMERAARNLELYEAEAVERTRLLMDKNAAYAALKELLQGKQIDAMAGLGMEHRPDVVTWEDAPAKKPGLTYRFFRWIW